MKKSTPIILIILAVIVVIAALIIRKGDDEGRMILCSSITKLDNEQSGSIAEYHGYYVHDKYLKLALDDCKSDVEKLCVGDFRETYRDGKEVYVIFRDKSTRKNSAIRMCEEGNTFEVTFCEDVQYSIKYPKGSKGDITFFDYNKDTAVTISYIED